MRLIKIRLNDLVKGASNNNKKNKEDNTIRDQ